MRTTKTSALLLGLSMLCAVPLFAANNSGPRQGAALQQLRSGMPPMPPMPPMPSTQPGLISPAQPGLMPPRPPMPDMPQILEQGQDMQRGKCRMGSGLVKALGFFGVLTEIAAIGALVSLSIFLIRRSRLR